MIQSYVDATITMLRKERKIDEILETVRSKVRAICEENTSYAPDLRRLDSGDTLYLCRYGKEIGSIWLTNFYRIEKNSNVEVSKEIVNLYEDYTKKNEILEVLSKILISGYKNNLINEFPLLKDVFARTDQYIKNQEKLMCDRWAGLKAELAEFLA